MWSVPSWSPISTASWMSRPRAAWRPGSTAIWRTALVIFRPTEKGGKVAPKHRQEVWRKLTSRAAKWPDFAVAATSLVRDEKLKVETQLGPNKLEHFAPLVQEAVRRQLLPA